MYMTPELRSGLFALEPGRLGVERLEAFCAQRRSELTEATAGDAAHSATAAGGAAGSATAPEADAAMGSPARKAAPRPRVLPLELQRLFSEMQLLDSGALGTVEMTERSFEWYNDEGCTQHDVTELNRKLYAKLQSTLQRTPAASLIQSLYGGRRAAATTFLGDHASASRRNVEPCEDMDVTVAKQGDLIDGLRRECAPEVMAGDNAVQVFDDGPKANCLRTTTYEALPPVLTVNLKRYKLCMRTFEPKKVTYRYEFPLVLDMRPFVEGGEVHEAQQREAARSAGSDVAAAVAAVAGAEPTATDLENAARQRCVWIGDLRTPEGRAEAAGRSAELERTWREAEAADASTPCLVYDLSAVVSHIGTATGGHYHVYCRSVAGEGTWTAPRSALRETSFSSGVDAGVAASMDLVDPSFCGGATFTTRSGGASGFTGSRGRGNVAFVSATGDSAKEREAVQVLVKVLASQSVSVLHGRHATAMARLGGLIADFQHKGWNKTFGKHVGKLAAFVRQRPEFEVLGSTVLLQKDALAGSKAVAAAGGGRLGDEDMDDDERFARKLQAELNSGGGAGGAADGGGASSGAGGKGSGEGAGSGSAVAPPQQTAQWEEVGASGSHAAALAAAAPAPAAGDKLAAAPPQPPPAGHALSPEEAAAAAAEAEEAAKTARAEAAHVALAAQWGEWYDFGDSSVTPVSVFDLMSQFQGTECAYMLIYRARSLASAPRGIGIDGPTDAAEGAAAAELEGPAAPLPSAAAFLSAPPQPPAHWVAAVEAKNRAQAADRRRYDELSHRISLKVFAGDALALDAAWPVLRQKPEADSDEASAGSAAGGGAAADGAEASPASKPEPVFVEVPIDTRSSLLDLRAAVRDALAAAGRPWRPDGGDADALPLLHTVSAAGGGKHAFALLGGATAESGADAHDDALGLGSEALKGVLAHGSELLAWDGVHLHADGGTGWVEACAARPVAALAPGSEVAVPLQSELAGDAVAGDPVAAVEAAVPLVAWTPGGAFRPVHVRLTFLDVDVETGSSGAPELRHSRSQVVLLACSTLEDLVRTARHALGAAGASVPPSDQLAVYKLFKDSRGVKHERLDLRTSADVAAARRLGGKGAAAVGAAALLQRLVELDVADGAEVVLEGTLNSNGRPRQAPLVGREAVARTTRIEVCVIMRVALAAGGAGGGGAAAGAGSGGALLEAVEGGGAVLQLALSHDTTIHDAKRQALVKAALHSRPAASSASTAAAPGWRRARKAASALMREFACCL